MNQQNEPHNRFIASLSGKLDVCSDLSRQSIPSPYVKLANIPLVFTIACVFYSSLSIRALSKRSLATIIVLCLAKTIMGILRVSITNGYMGYGYTWSLYWQTLEAYALIVLESHLIIRSVFVPIEKIEAHEYLALSREGGGI